MGFNLDTINPFDNGHVLDLSGGGPGNTLTDFKNLVGLGATPSQFSTPYKINQGAFGNPAGNFAPQLGTALGGYLGGAYQPVQTSGFTTGAGAGLGGLAQQYSAMAAGQGPSLANVQAQQQGAQNLQQAESMLGSARGAGSPAGAQLAAANALTNGQQQVAQNAVQGRTAEELGALGGLGNTYGALGGIGNNVQQLGVANQGANQNAWQQYLQALMEQNKLQQTGAIQGQQLGAQNDLAFKQLQSSNFAGDQNRTSQFIGGLIKAGAGAAAGGGMGAGGGGGGMSAASVGQVGGA